MVRPRTLNGEPVAGHDVRVHAPPGEQAAVPGLRAMRLTAPFGTLSSLRAVVRSRVRDVFVRCVLRVRSGARRASVSCLFGAVAVTVMRDFGRVHQPWALPLGPVR